MSVWDRPYAGNYRPNRRKVVRYTPDAVVLLNGDTNIPGNNPEHKVIDIQKYLTQVSVDAGTEAGSASASFTLSIPKTVGSTLFSDGHSVFQPGLEVHVYMRGYFPVEELPKTLSGPELDALKQVLGDEIENLALRPYYHCFHGVTTTANLEYSGGFYSINMSCSGMLHFWQYHDISTNASLFGTRPTGSKLKMSLVGHNFTNMTPFSIIYSLYKDTAGAAGGVAFALSSSSNQSKKFFDSGSSLFEQAQMYWEKRFQSKMYNLRMFGVNGEMLNTAQTAMVGRMTTKQLKRAAEINLRHIRSQGTQPVEPLRADQSWDTPRSKDVSGTQYRYRSLSQAMLEWVPRAGEKSGYAVSAAQLKAFVNDIGQWGSVNLWESNYTSKLDIAAAASTAVGFEFYQDVDGDLVFKPPLYNMDTRNLPAYNIEPLDIISLTRASAEPQCTYMTVKSGQFSNWKGLSLEGEWGIRGQYIDYRLVAKYGWRPGDFDAQFYSDARGAFWAAVARIDILNEAMETANITIPLRPELRPGYPVYVKHLDCFFYIKSMSHSFSYGGQCTTSLQCVAMRKKFLPPGDPSLFKVDSGSGSSPTDNLTNGLKAVTLSRPDLPGVPLVRRRGDDGEFYLAGFPNVVMALDPLAVSPLIWALGQDVTDLSNLTDVRNLVALLSGHNNKHPLNQTIEAGLAGLDLKGKNGPLTGPLVKTVDTSNGGNVAGQFQSAKAVDAWFAAEGSGDIDVYIPIERKPQGQQTATWKYVKLDLKTIKDQMKSWNKFLKKVNEGKEDFKTTVVDVTDTQKWKDAIKDYDQELKDKIFGKGANLDDTATVFDLMSLIDVVADKTNPEPDMLNSARILDLLGDKKANFSNASTPGYYRYFSSSHPNPNDQSPNNLTATQKSNGGHTTDAAPNAFNTFDGEIFKKADSPLNPGNEVQSPKLRVRYVEIDKNPDKNVRTFRIAGSGGLVEDKHTDEIRTFSFSKFPLQLHALVPQKFSRPVKSSVDAVTKGEYAIAISNYIEERMDALDLEGSLYGTFYNHIIEQVDTLQLPGKALQGHKISQPIKIAAGVNTSKAYDLPPFNPSNLTVDEYNAKYASSNKSLRMQIADYGADGQATSKGSAKLADVPMGQIGIYLGGGSYYKNARGKLGSPPRTSSLDTKKIDIDKFQKYFHGDFSKRLSARIFKCLEIALDEWNRTHRKFMTKQYRDKPEQLKGIEEFSKFDEFMKNLNQLLGVRYNKKLKKSGGFRLSYLSMTNSNKFKGKGVYAKMSNVLTPVFPISDEGGYQVFGSYAYGRGVSVGENGTLDQLISKDPLTELDDSIVDGFVRQLLKRGGKAIRENTHLDDGENNMIEAIMTMQTDNPSAFTRIMKMLKVKQKEEDGNKVVSVQTIIDGKSGSKVAPSKPELKNLIGLGLINHFNRDDTPGTYTNPLNAARSLADIIPGRSKGADPTVGDEVLWDSMVRLQAGDENSFIYVMPEGADGQMQSNVVKTVQQQIAESAGPHFQIQDEYRGKKEKPRANIDFEAIGKGWGEDSVFRDAIDKFQQWGRAFGGEVPDDPQLAAAFSKLEAAKMQVALNQKSLDRGDPWDPSLSQADRDAREAQDRADYLQGNQTAANFLGGGTQDEGEEEVASNEGGIDIVIDD